jgi:hypothetical protein
MALTIKALELIFNHAQKTGANHVAVVIEMEGFPANEVIINERANFLSKLTYYKKTYDENCNHKFAKGIRIVDAASGAYYSDIERELTL